MDIEALERMLATGADNALLRVTLGKLHFDRGEYDKATAHLKAALLQDSAYSAAYKWLGRTLVEQGEYVEARKTFDAGIAVAGKNGDKQAEKEMQVFLRRLDKN